ncbi:MAG: potassium-transporting ATPase subunit KdpA [Deinococcaceae bacterium]
MLFVGVYLVVLLAAYPLGKYIAKAMQDEKHLAIERGLYRLMGVNPGQGMNWKTYSLNFLLSNLILAAMAYVLFLFQGVLPLNPDGIAGMRWDLALHTAASFITNTNQQHYSGQNGLSHLSQMMGIVSLQFITPAMGLALLFAILRLFKGGQGEDIEGLKNLGNYHVDVTRAIVRILLPLCFLFAIFLVSEGVPSAFSGAVTATTLEGAKQVIPLGPVAALEAIKQLGTNGGGWFGPNSAHPFENPTPLTNLLETIALFLIPAALVFSLGEVLKARKLSVITLSVMVALSLAGSIPLYFLEKVPNSAFLGLAQSTANWEGKETRLGIEASALWSALTTQTSNGSVNAMQDSLSSLAGMIPQINMFLNDIFGGIGVGLINYLLFAMLTVFIAGLMVGRTPELFGRKLEAKEIQWVSLAVLLQPFLILGFTALTLSNPSLAGTSNPGYHGISQVLYEFNSAYANNGSGFEGLGDNTYWWNITCAIVLILARFLPMLIPLAVAGLLAQKTPAPTTAGTLRIDTPVFALTLVSVMVLLQLLNFLPTLTLGHIADALTSGGLK